MSNEAIISRDNIHRNIEEICRFLPEKCRVMAVLKGNAYGHGVARIAPLMDGNPSVDMMGVASPDEAAELCCLGVRKPILILGQTSREWLLEGELPEQVLFSVGSLEEAQMFEAAGTAAGRRFSMHLRLDFSGGVRGMDRRTFQRHRDRLLHMPGVCGLYAHVNSAYTQDASRAERDFMEYDSVIQNIPANLRAALTCHVLTSVSFYRFPAYAYDMVRVGAALYGLPLPGESEQKPNLLSALSIRATVLKVLSVTTDSALDYWYEIPSHVRKVALLSAGSWDIPNFFRGKRVHVCIGRRLLELTGSPCMDTCCVDVTYAPEVRPGDKAYFLQDAPGVRLADKVRENGFGYADCQMLFSGMDRLKKVYG